MDIKIAIVQGNDEVGLMSFITVGVGNILPHGGEWVDKEDGQWIRQATDEEIEYEISRCSFFEKPIKSWRRVNVSEIPTDRTYRNALRDVSGKLEHSMPVARELHRDRIRHARARAFLQLDGEWFVATGKADTKAVSDVEAIRQRLRDLPDDPRIEAASTTEELKAVWDEELK